MTKFIETKESDFIELLVEDKESITISGRKILDSVSIIVNPKAKGIVIESCIFEDTVCFDNITLDCSIVFIKCEFLKSLEFKQITNPNEKNDIRAYNLLFRKVNISTLTFQDNTFFKGIKIERDSSIDNLFLFRHNILNGGLRIENSKINRGLVLNDIEFSGSIQIFNYDTFKAEIQIDNFKVSHISLSNSIFSNKINIYSGEVEEIYLHDSTYSEDVNLICVSISKNLNIYEAVFGRSFKLSFEYERFSPDLMKSIKEENTFRYIENIVLSSINVSEAFSINGKKSNLNDFLIGGIELIYSNQFNASIFINSCQIKETKLIGEKSNGNLVINNCKFNNLCFEYFNNYSTCSIISFGAMGEQAILNIYQSNLGETKFYNSSFKEFSDINIINSTLIDITTTNVNWFDDSILNSKEPNEISKYITNKEIYRQLKFSNEKQGDRITSLHFKSLEMKNYKKQLFSNVHWFKKPFNIDRFVLLVGGINNYGQNWVKPTLFALIFGLILHFFIVIGVSDIISWKPSLKPENIIITWNEYWIYFKKIWLLMNPALSIDKIFAEKSGLHGSVYFWGLLLKIILAFFIYQIVTAFRKYMKYKY